MKSDIISIFHFLASLLVLSLVSERLSLYFDKMAAVVSSCIHSNPSPYKNKELSLISYPQRPSGVSSDWL